MQRFIYLWVLTLCVAAQAYAQGNVLGLPAVPQVPQPPVGLSQGASAAGKATPPGAAASGSKAPQIKDAQGKAVLSGGVTLATSYDGRTATVLVTTNTAYPTEDQRKAAVAAARLVQRDVRLSCGKQCKAAPNMPAPKILTSGKLEFAMVVGDYPRTLSNDDVIALLLGKPLAVVPASMAKAAGVAPPGAEVPTLPKVSVGNVALTPAVPAAPVPAPATSGAQ